MREYLEAKLAGLINALAELPAPVVPPSPAAGVESDRAAALLSALRETIDVLRQTKRSFKSKALGELRAKLESLVEKFPAQLEGEVDALLGRVGLVRKARVAAVTPAVTPAVEAAAAAATDVTVAADVAAADVSPALVPDVVVEAPKKSRKSS